MLINQQKDSWLYVGNATRCVRVGVSMYVCAYVCESELVLLPEGSGSRTKQSYYS